MISRRRFLERTGVLAAGMSISKLSFPQPPLTTLDPDKLSPYVDPLPIPQIAQPSGTRPSPDDASIKLPYYRMAMRPIESKVHRDLPATRMWGFGSSSPGPSFETRSNQGLIVEWVNELPQRHFLPIDHTLRGAEKTLPEVRSVIHLHGGKTPPGSDGYPEHWYVPGKSATFHYPNRQDAAMLFYHDHTMGINRLNIYAGLQGMYFIRDEAEDALKLPKGKYEIPLLVYDRFLLPDGQLEYPVSDKVAAPWVPEVFGNAILVNGKLFPYLEVEPRKYRLRLMNGSNGRFYRFSLGKLLTFQQIGTEQGFLPSPVAAQRVVMAPAERIDLIFDFAPHAGENILLRSDAFEIMQFRVAAKSTPDPSSLPPALRSFSRIPESSAVKTRRLTLDERMDPVQQSMGMLLNNMPWHMPVTEKPVLNTTEIWELVNLTEDAHPIHLHLVRFQILDRRPFDKYEFQDKGTVRFTGPAILPAATEAGWKDTVRADPGLITRIIVPFEGFTGRYVWHCHILEHEDNEMMRPYEVVEAGSSG
ncbi:MAG: multicopper oxidase [Acidobacteriaceae bacterium]